MVIDRYLRGEPLVQPRRPRLPEIYVEPLVPEGEGDADRPGPRRRALPIPARRRSFAEVETALSAAEAAREARRCLRCDLEFTQAEARAASTSSPAPARRTAMINLTINGLAGRRSRRARTLLEAAQFLGFPIPTLCHMEGLVAVRRLPAVRGRDRRGAARQAGLLVHLPGRGGAQGAHRVGAGGAGAAHGHRAAARLLPAVEDDPGPRLGPRGAPAALPPGARGLHPVRPLRAHVRGADDGARPSASRGAASTAASAPRSTRSRRCAGCAAAASTSARPASSAAPTPSRTRRSAAAAPTSARPASRSRSFDDMMCYMKPCVACEI